MTVRLIPSVEVLLVAHLRASSDVAALAGDRIGTELYAGSGPAVWLSLVTGSADWPGTHLIRPVIDVRSYGGTKAAADLLARTVHAVIHDAVGTHTQGVVTAVDTLTIPAWSPDDTEEPPRPRYLASYEFVVHPALPV